MGLLRGEAGCGKTFLALDIGLHVAAGGDWFGRWVAPGGVV
jgi:RecA-family ATPase